MVSCLLSHGHEVVALIRDRQKGASLSRQGASIQIGDLRNQDDILKTIKGTRIAINLAVPSYAGRLGMGRVQHLAIQHMQNVKSIVEAAGKAGNIPLIISEGSLMWGDSGDGWVDETSELRPLGMGRAGELAVPYVQKMIDETKAPVIRIAPCAVYGAGSWFQNAVYTLMKKGWFRTFGNGQNIMSFVYVEDVAEAYRLAVEKQPLGERFAIADDTPTRFKDFANCVAKVMGKPPVKSMPGWLGSLFAGKVMVEQLTMNHQVRNARAKEKLGWRPQYPSFEQGIPKAIAEIERQ